MGHLMQIEGQNEPAITLRARLSSTDLSYEELIQIMNHFLE